MTPAEKAAYADKLEREIMPDWNEMTPAERTARARSGLGRTPGEPAAPGPDRHIDLGGGPMYLWACGRCKALTLMEHKDDHQAWHNQTEVPGAV